VRAEASLLAFCRTPETIALAVHQVTASEANETCCWDATTIWELRRCDPFCPDDAISVMPKNLI
jgi:hypothetical protein